MVKLKKSIPEKFLHIRRLTRDGGILYSLEAFIEINPWIKHQAAIRAEDRNFNQIKFDLMSEALTEDTYLQFRNEYSHLRNVWRRFPVRLKELTDIQQKKRLESLNKLFSWENINSKLVDTSCNGITSWTLTAELENISVNISTLPSGMLFLTLPFYNRHCMKYSNQAAVPGGVPYTDKQFIEVLKLVDLAIPDIEKEVKARVTNLLKQKASRTISNISSNAAIRKMMDETGLPYIARQSSDGIRISIQIGDVNRLDFKTRQLNNTLSAAKLSEAADAARKIIDILGTDVLISK